MEDWFSIISLSLSNQERQISLLVVADQKTVLLKSIVGLLEPDNGEIWFEDVLLTDLALKTRRR